MNVSIMQAYKEIMEVLDDTANYQLNVTKNNNSMVLDYKGGRYIIRNNNELFSIHDLTQRKEYVNQTVIETTCFLSNLK